MRNHRLHKGCNNEEGRTPIAEIRPTIAMAYVQDTPGCLVQCRTGRSCAEHKGIPLRRIIAAREPTIVLKTERLLMQGLKRVESTAARAGIVGRYPGVSEEAEGGNERISCRAERKRP